MEGTVEEFGYSEDGVNDFYEGFEVSLEDDEISGWEEGFWLGLSELTIKRPVAGLEWRCFRWEKAIHRR